MMVKQIKDNSFLTLKEFIERLQKFEDLGENAHVKINSYTVLSDSIRISLTTHEDESATVNIETHKPAGIR